MATVKKDDGFSIAAFDPSRIMESFRDFAEKGAQQSKDAFSKMKGAAEDAGKTVETTVQNAQAGGVELGLQAIEAFRTNAENSFAHMEALLGARSVAEFVELQTSFFRKQAEVTADQARSMQATSKKIAETVAQPAKAAAEKAMASFKAA